MLVIVNGDVKYYSLDEINTRQKEFADYCSENKIIATGIWYTKYAIIVITVDNNICHKYYDDDTLIYNPNIPEKIIMVYLNGYEVIIVTENGSVWVNNLCYDDRTWRNLNILPISNIGLVHYNVEARTNDGCWHSLGTYKSGYMFEHDNRRDNFKHMISEQQILYVITLSDELIAMSVDPELLKNGDNPPYEANIDLNLEGKATFIMDDINNFSIGRGQEGSLIYILDNNGKLYYTEEPYFASCSRNEIHLINSSEVIQELSTIHVTFTSIGGEKFRRNTSNGY